jgi:hypothetical protein
MKKRKLRKRMKRALRELRQSRYEARNRCRGGIVHTIGTRCPRCGAGIRDECGVREAMAS